MDLNKLLKGFKLGVKQEVGVMSVVPLLSEDATDNLASFDDVKFIRTSDYGNMVFKNNSDKPFILPSGYSIITKQQAQDHGLGFSYLLEPEKERNISGAYCIEETQGGYIVGEEKDNFNLLPLYVRKEHYKGTVHQDGEKLNHHQQNFSKLWPIISRFQNELIGQREAHLVYFFNRFVEQLNQFNAEFETVNGQRGAIILLNNRIVGIEIAPTEDYWNVIWKRLIRDCYGSEVVRLTFNNLIGEFKGSQELELNLDDAASIEEIEDKLEEYVASYQDQISGKLKGILNEETLSLPDFNPLVKSNKFNKFEHHVLKLKESEGFGEVYTEDGNVVYASILL